MASWILIPCLVELRGEFNAIAPNRDKSSDGSIGDAAHQDSQSDHNDDEIGNVPIRDADKIHEVHAIDVDVDLREPGLSMERVVQFLLARCRSGAETRLRYIIYNRRIWSASNGWRQQAYTGANAHDHHAHFSARYDTTSENNTKPWGLLAANTPEEDDVLNADDKKWISAEIRKQADLAVADRIDDIWRYDVGAASGRPKQTAFSTLVTANMRAGSVANDQAPKTNALLGQLVAGQLDQGSLVTALTSAFLAAVTPLLDDSDVVTTAELEQAILNAARKLISPVANA